MPMYNIIVRSRRAESLQFSNSLPRVLTARWPVLIVCRFLVLVFSITMLPS
jgi:hypothetical protein